MTYVDLLVQLAHSTNLSDARSVVADLETRFGFAWRALGDRENNFGTVNIGSDPGNALVERITNAIDAVIEAHAATRLREGKSVLPSTPREAAEVWFSIPSGRVKNLSISDRQKLANAVTIRLLPSSNDRNPSVEIRDLGIGLTSDLMPDTILSLGGSNKIDKPYLAGAYGQGGSTVFAFSPDGALIRSRRQPNLRTPGDEDHIALTFVRYNDLPPTKNKNGRYEYLVDANQQVPSIPAAAFGSFEPGTSVIHFDLQIPQYSATLTQLTGSLWWLLQNALFDPVLPLWAEEHRPRKLKKGETSTRRTIAGNYSRLSEDAKDRVEHQDTVEVGIPDSRGQSKVRVNYWVIRESEDDGKRKRPIDAYVDPNSPVTYTFFGQTHGTDDRRFVTDRLSLPYLDKYLIIQVELDYLSPYARRDLLSSTRDRLKNSALYSEMRERISSALAEDQDLIRLNDERREAILSSHSDAERERMKQRFAKLMEVFRAGTDAVASGKGSETGGRPEKKPSKPHPLPPLKTNDYPSFLRLANTQRPVPIQIGRSALLRLESDAPDRYLSAHAHARLVLSTEPEHLLRMSSVSDFNGGRSRMMVTPSTSVRAGDEATVIVVLFTPQNESFSVSTKVRFVDPEEAPRSGSDGRAQIQAPEPVWINKSQWQPLGWDESSVAKVNQESAGTKIFVNVDNRHVLRLLSSGGYQEAGIKRMKANYVLYVAFYAWLQHHSRAATSELLSGSDYEVYLTDELDRVAQTVVHSISAVSRLED